jgi:hypothetical protein
MKKYPLNPFLALLAGFAMMAISGGQARATPSTTLWIPSVDIQKYGVLHLGVDTYNTVGKKAADGGRMFPVDYGLTIGVTPFEAWGMEVGVDMMEASDYPMMYNAKAALNEGALGDWSPALAIGGYNFGTKGEVTEYNMMYVLVAKTFGALGRIHAGFYSGNDKLLVDKDGKKAASGLLASWDLAVTDKWWVAVDYQGGKSSFGAVSAGFAYTVSPNSSFIFAYNIYADQDAGGKNKNLNTLEFNLDINF